MTALVKVYKRDVEALDAALYFNLSKAFDTVAHSVLSS